MTAIYRMILLLFMMAIVCFFFSASAHAWLFYSKPEFRGRVIDAETKEPIEGAVVVVLYKKWESHGPGGGSSVPFDAKETLTDKNGEFYFSSFTTLIGPLSKKSRADFIFFKPGYKAISSISEIEGIRISDEIYFALAKDMVGKEGEIKEIDEWETLHTYKGPLGMVELKKAKTREEKLRTMPSPPTDYTSKELPVLIKTINAEYNNLGVKGGYK